MGAASTSETSANFYQTILRYNPENSHQNINLSGFVRKQYVTFSVIRVKSCDFSYCLASNRKGGYSLVTHFTTLFLNAYGRSQFEWILIHYARWRCVCVGYDFALCAVNRLASGRRSLKDWRGCHSLTVTSCFRRGEYSSTTLVLSFELLNVVWLFMNAVLA
jgi:hypothetical protein